mgnify:CR=1 FL=1
MQILVVLILVLMEDALVLRFFCSVVFCLLPTVLILVLMEDALVHKVLSPLQVANYKS